MLMLGAAEMKNIMLKIGLAAFAFVLAVSAFALDSAPASAIETEAVSPDFLALPPRSEKPGTAR
jgi:hypothetical protein